MKDGWESIMVNSSKKMARIVKTLRNEGRRVWWDKFYAIELNCYFIMYKVKEVQ